MVEKRKRILIPTDFSDHSNSALQHACEIASEVETTSVQLHLLHATHGSPIAETNSALEEIDIARHAKHEDFEIVKQVSPGEPSQVIRDYAKDHDVDLIVMGTHGRTGLSHLALGSVAERVIRDATCPVVVLGPRERERQVTLATAATAIIEEFGEQFSLAREEGIERMQKFLRDKFSIHTATCIRLMDELLSREWLVWEEGHWNVLTGLEFIAETSAMNSDRPDSQATDLIGRATQKRATDVHIDPVDSKHYVIRFRIDGKVSEYCRLDISVAEHLINQLKTAAGLDITDPFRPQEGRIASLTIPHLEVRVTSAQVAGGEAIALRLFDARQIFLSLQSLGLSDRAYASIQDMLKLGEGLVLITGPTGSGKTTTVYSMLQTLGAASDGGSVGNIVSVEDPVEFPVPFVRQLAVDSKHGITMTTGLRTILRMDPDVVFLGEIRDPEAAHIAMRAANSGKYVLSTLHTRDVASTVTALRDMDIADRTAAGHLTGIINQRLVRKLCPECKQSATTTAAEAAHFQSADVAPPDVLFTPVGCAACRDTGYRGRTGVFEVALVDDTLSNEISCGADESELYSALRERGVPSLLHDALTKAAQGVTSLSEATSVRWLG